MMYKNMPSFDDKEGMKTPAGLPQIIDAHVHLFPANMFSAVWKWFDDNAWAIRYRLASSRVIDFLLSRGIRHVVALQYAHKPGIARDLNRYMAEKCQDFGGRITGMATVFPGEPDAEKILQEAFDSGLGGLKLHAHVQCFDMNGPAMNRLYECCRTNGKPIVMHVGRQPASTAYRCDPFALCSAEKTENVLKDFPDLKICVPHLGFDETAAYRKLAETHDNLWLDTTMVITDYFRMNEKIDLARYRADRIMYGSDFPNIPYAWDRELKALQAMNLPEVLLERIAAENARDFFGIKP